MRLDFVYVEGKDVENFLKSINSKNNKEYTNFHKLYFSTHSNKLNYSTVALFIRDYTSSKNIDFETEVSNVKLQWNLISKSFIYRVESLFNLHLSDTITVYLTTNERCTYNISLNYFFLFYKAKSTNTVIMHELFHFYTWYKYKKYEAVAPSVYNAVKEGLTELLNIEFSDLMNNTYDKGYKQHALLRDFIRKEWLKEKNLDVVFDKAIFFWANQLKSETLRK